MRRVQAKICGLTEVIAANVRDGDCVALQKVNASIRSVVCPFTGECLSAVCAA